MLASLVANLVREGKARICLVAAASPVAVDRAARLLRPSGLTGDADRLEARWRR
jgi:hypothetical protein